MLDIGGIGIRHFTAHRLHLKESRKRFLSRIIVKRMTHMTFHQHQPWRPSTPLIPVVSSGASSTLTPTVVQDRTFAEATSHLTATGSSSDSEPSPVSKSGRTALTTPCTASYTEAVGSSSPNRSSSSPPSDRWTTIQKQYLLIYFFGGNSLHRNGLI